MALAPRRPNAAPRRVKSTHRETVSTILRYLDDLDTSLSSIYEKLVYKIQLELHKSTNVLSQEIAAIEGITDILETKHDEFSLAHNDLRKDYKMLADNFSYMQAQIED